MEARPIQLPLNEYEAVLVVEALEGKAQSLQRYLEAIADSSTESERRRWSNEVAACYRLAAVIQRQAEAVV